MPTVEAEALRDDFTLGLLCAHYDPRRGVAVWELVSFRGGVEQARETFPAPTGGTAHGTLRPRLAAFLQERSLLAACGLQWRLLVAETAPEFAALLSAFDLHATAAVLAGLPARCDLNALCARFQLPQVQAEEALPTAFWESVLWAVLREAGRQGMDRRALLGAAEAARHAPSFANCRFGAETLEALPASPGVYVMRDAAGQVLYVGKAANLRRRLADYFRTTYQLSEKLAAIRQRIHDVSFQIVGSELEALLWEARLIRELGPGLNVQRRVAEGTSRYETPVLPSIVFGRSVRPHHVEAFVLAPGKGLQQVRFRPDRPPRDRLTRLAAYACSPAAHAVRGTGCTDWGTDGLEIAWRHVARNRPRLACMALHDGETQSDAVALAARTFLLQEPEAVEFREEPAAQAP